MKDIALDDLIQEDKKKRQEFKKKPHLKPRNNNNRNGPPKTKFINRNHNRVPATQGNTQNQSDFRKKRFGKRFQNRNKFNRNDRNNQNDRNDNRRQPYVPQQSQRQPVKPQENREKGRTLRVMGLHPDFTNQDLNNLFASQGALEKCVIEQDNFGRSLTTAIVRYHSAESAKNAIKNLHQHKIMNSVLTVEPYKRIPRR